MTVAPSGTLRVEHALPDARRALVDLDIHDLEVLLAQLEQVDEPVLGHLVLDHREHAQTADTVGEIEEVEVLLVLRVVDARDHLLDPVPLSRDLADHDVVLVVAGHGDDDVGRALDPGPLEHVELGRVAADEAMLELVLEALEAEGALLDQGDLVAVADQRAGDVRADLPPPATMTNIV